ncbi:hypothetical protein SK128_013479 [Halocaridina rubra]|uniref:Uncharacterized protein n=1 Tax=Halocaridina rubra TaxID=373956 RepID=A0AAN8WU59_HALRR
MTGNGHGHSGYHPLQAGVGPPWLAVSQPPGGHCLNQRKNNTPAQLSQPLLHGPNTVSPPKGLIEKHILLPPFFMLYLPAHSTSEKHPPHPSQL